MPNILRPDIPPAESRRWAVGTQVSSDCTRLLAVLVAARGRGLSIRPQVIDGVIAKIPGDWTAAFRRLTEAAEPNDAAELPLAVCSLRSRLADLEGSLILALLEQAETPPERILVVGLHDPGLWRLGKSPPTEYLGLSDPTRVAEATGLNVVDAFSARDLACGGQGGPIFAQAERVMVGDAERNRLVVDLGRTTRMTYLPKQTSGSLNPRVVSFEVGPGMRLVDLLAQRFSGGEHEFDPGGRFAVQGRCIDELLNHWLGDPSFRRPLPRWQPYGVQPDRYLLEAMQLAVDRGWAIRDVLCTAPHLIAAMVGSAVKKLLPPDTSIDEVVLTGGGQQNGLLLRELGTQLPGIPMLRINELGMESEAYTPTCVAMMALFHLDQVPGNSPEVTGAEVSRVLGCLTPGSPQSWQRLVADLGSAPPAVRTLRSAL